MKCFIKLNEETKYEAELLKLFNLYSKNNEPKPAISLKNYLENVYIYKNFKKLINANGQPDENNLAPCSFLRSFKCLFTIKQIQCRIINENTYDLEFLTKELVLYNLYKEYEDLSSKNGVQINEMVLLLNMLLYEYISEFLIINKEKSENAFIDMFIEEKEKEKVTHVNFLIFSKILKAIILFLINVEKFKLIFDSLDFEGKNKILTAELVVCLNKIYRILNEQDKLNLRIKTLSEIIDASKVYMKKSDFYKLVIQLYII